ncbi:MAG: NAD(P)H-dependent oxidoreductase [Crenarchaeota archaeon]|nr:NAD(P)H-dependent oxidoreductase [Thermoproteota archaeon]
MVRVLIVSASPREYGYVRRASEFARRVATEVMGEEASWIDLYNYRIHPCVGCVSDNVKACYRPCPIDDDWERIADMVEGSDALILVTPIYWYNVSTPMKCFIDRLTTFENAIFVEGRSRLEGKVAAFAAIGNDVGAIAVIQNLMIVLNSMGAVIPPWALAYHTSEESPLRSEKFVLDMANVVSCSVLMARALKGLGIPREWYRADREFVERVTKIAEEVDREFDEMLYGS